MEYYLHLHQLNQRGLRTHKLIVFARFFGLVLLLLLSHNQALTQIPNQHVETLYKSSFDQNSLQNIHMGDLSWTKNGRIPFATNINRVIGFDSNSVMVQSSNNLNNAHTTDGGESWVLTTDKKLLNDNQTTSQQFVNNWYKSHDDIIWTYSGAYLFKSTNKGVDWYQFNLTSLGNNAFHPISGITSKPNGEVWVWFNSMNNAVFRSSDGGQNWTRVNFFNGFQHTSLHFTNNQHGYFIRDQAGLKEIYQSLDGGSTWSLRSSTMENLREIHLGPDGNGFRYFTRISGPNEITFFQRTRDGGQSWLLFSIPGISYVINQSVKKTSDGIIWFRNNSGSDECKSDCLVVSQDYGFQWAVIPISSLHSSYSNVTIQTVDFTSDHTIYIGANLGNIFMSTDLGHSWNKIDKGIPGTIYAGIIDDDGNYLYAAGDYIVRQDRTSGQQELATLPQSRGMLDFRFVTDRTWVYYTSYYESGLTSSVQRSYITRDSGQNWELFTPPEGISSDTRSYKFFDDHNFLAISGGKRFTSSNAGMTWQEYEMNIDLFEGRNVTSQGFISELEGYAYIASTRSLMKTTDGGQTWVVWNDSMPMYSNSRSTSMSYTKDNVVFLSAWYESSSNASSYVFLTSFDGGRNFNIIDYVDGFSEGARLRYVDVLENGTLVIGVGGRLLYSIDQGASFNRLFQNVNETFIGAYLKADEWVVFTSNGNFYIATLPPISTEFTCGDFVYDIEMNRYPTVKIAEQCWMAKNLNSSRFNDGSIIPNYTSAEQWSTTTSAQWVNYREYTWAPYATVNYGGKLYNYFAVSSPNGLCPTGWKVPEEHDWETLRNNIGPNEGLKLKSRFGWQNNGNGNDLYQFNAEPIGRVGSSGSSFSGKGTAARFWSSTVLSEDQIVNYILQNDRNDLLKSDGGNSPNNGFSVRCIFDPNYTSIEESGAAELPSRIELHQNYPNPFNPVTVISFSLPDRDEITLTLYDVTGRVVRTIVAQHEYSPGVHSITFDGSGLASGIYLYSVRTTSGTILIRKMALIK